MIEFGTSSIPNIATTKAVPLKTTARLAVAPEARDRVELLAAAAALLAVAGDDEERVVDPEREAHPGEHVHDEDRELERLREERGEPQRDDDRDDRHQQRDEPGDDRAEHEQEDDQRRGQAELELALLEILLREQVEVVVERLVAGDRDREGRVLVGRLDGLDRPRSASSSSRIASGTIVAWRSSETSEVHRRRRDTCARRRARRHVARPRATATNDSNCGESTV